VPIFTAREMRRRFRLLSTGLAERGIDLALFHTADNVFYTTGVPLLSEWGRPMWSATRPNGAITSIGAMIERENMERHAWFSDVRVFPDQENVWRASVGAVRDFARSSGPPPRRIGVERELLPLRVYEALRAVFDRAEFVEHGDLVAAARIVKSREEIRLLRLGGEIAKIGASAFLEALGDGTTELVVAAEAVAAMDRALAALLPEGLTSSYAYCQVGLNTLTPHLHPTGRRIRRGDLVGLNVFPVIWGYCVELERTFVFGDPTAEQARLLAVVGEAFEACKTADVAGQRACDVDRVSREIFARHALERYVRHGTGHAHGIMIGAAGREELGELRSYNQTELRPNMVNSIEPGLYLPDLGGFRHSDVMLVQDGPPICLTDFPVEIGL
jgi:Xaa-Pro aminopeptidase